MFVLIYTLTLLHAGDYQPHNVIFIVMSDNDFGNTCMELWKRGFTVILAKAGVKVRNIGEKALLCENVSASFERGDLVGGGLRSKLLFSGQASDY